MKRHGFTLVELVMVIAIGGLLMTMMVPRVRGATEVASVRAARVALGNAVARARASATARGCTAVFHVVQGAQGRVWVTACRLGTVGRVSATSIDTVGAVDSLVRRTGLDLQTSLDSIPFDARGISARYGTFTLYVTGPRTGKRDSILINPAGKVVYP